MFNIAQKINQDEGDGAEGDKKEKKVPSGTPLFDDEMVDSKANVKEKADQLLKQGCECLLNQSSPFLNRLITLRFQNSWTLLISTY